MNDAVKICGVLAIAAVVCLILKQMDQPMARLVGITGIVISAVFAMESFTPVIEYTSTMGEVAASGAQIVVRVLGIAYITEFAASLCRDTGESGLASGIDLAGKAEILVISFPLFRQLTDYCMELLQ